MIPVPILHHTKYRKRCCWQKAGTQNEAVRQEKEIPVEPVIQKAFVVPTDFGPATAFPGWYGIQAYSRP